MVVIRQFFTRKNLALRFDKDATCLVFIRRAVGLARMVDPTRRVATHACIDHRSVIKLEQESMRRVLRIAVRTPRRFSPRCAFSLVFENPRSVADFPDREYAATADCPLADRSRLPLQPF